MTDGANISYANTAPEFEPQARAVEDAPIMASEPIIVEQAPAESIPDAPSPEVDVPEFEIVDPKLAEPTDKGGVLLEEALEPQPEG